MREYETLFISHPEQSEAQIASFNERVAQVIQRHKGRLFIARDLGKRQLAYPILKQAKGTYTCLDYAAEGNVVTEIEKLLRFDETILRFLTTVKHHDVDVEARAAEIIARGEDRAPLEAAIPELEKSDKEEEDVEHEEDE